VRIILLVFLSVAAFFEAGASARAQFYKTGVKNIKIGIEVTADGGPCGGLLGTLAVPT
jgi:hypothetical protein